MSKKRCNGILAKGDQCNKYGEGDNIYCNSHLYFVDLNGDQINKIKNGEAKCCLRCRKWHFGKVEQCQKCKDYNNQLKQTKIADRKCKWKDRHLDPCRKMAFDDTEYCGVHQYVKDYTDEMKQKSKLCKGCMKIKYLETGCDICRERAKQNRGKEKLQEKIICKGFIDNKPCTFEALENGYCGKHALQAWKGNVEKDGDKKVCANYKRGCKNLLELNSEYGKCCECREKEREDDKMRRLKRKAENKNIVIEDDEIINKGDIFSKKIQQILDDNKRKTLNNNKPIIDSDEYISVDEDNDNNISGKKPKDNIQNKTIEVRKCIMCHKYYTIDKFITLRGQSSDKCNVVCLPKEREKDKKRDRSGRNYSEYCNRPEVIERKKQWKEDNYDKVAGYWIDARARRIENEGIDEYHRKNNEYAKKHRLENPEKQKEINKRKCLNLNYKYNYYKREAENKGRNYELTREQSIGYFLDNCYYCGYGACSGVLLNGIDRKGNYGDYTVDNCVTACEMCNIMKGGELDDDQFIKVCEHILTNLGVVDGNSYQECLKDYTSGDYNSYKCRAKKNDIEFSLSNREFGNIVQNNCYLCGKYNSEIHNNGIDRINSSIGYYYNNCKACCGTCNYIKNNYPITDLLTKMITIYNYHNDKYSIINRQIYENLLKPYIFIENLDIDKINKDRNYMRNYRSKLKREMGEDKYREMRRLEKAKERGQIDENGNVMQRKKLTKEEKRERRRIQKQKERRALKEKYGDEIYCKMRAQEIAKNRANKKNIIMDLI